MTECFFRISEMTEKEYNKYFSMMSQEKQKRVNRFRFEDDRKRTVAGEMLARKMISDETGIDESSIVFLRDEKGKPYAKDIAIHFNLSHSGDFVLCVVNSSPVGVDIEKIRRVKDEVINRVCTVNELEYVNEKELTESERLKRFFEIWTFKEAYFKFTGTGITDFRSVDYILFDGNRKSGLDGEYSYCIIY